MARKKRATITAAGLSTLMGTPPPPLDVLAWAREMRRVFGSQVTLRTDPDGYPVTPVLPQGRKGVQSKP